MTLLTYLLTRVQDGFQPAVENVVKKLCFWSLLSRMQMKGIVKLWFWTRTLASAIKIIIVYAVWDVLYCLSGHPNVVSELYFA